MSTRMLQRRGLASEWAATNPILGSGEIGFIKDTGEIRIGDGVTPFETLTSPYVTKAGAVTSVAGRTGAVVLTAADVGGGTFPNTGYAFQKTVTYTGSDDGLVHFSGGVSGSSTWVYADVAGVQKYRLERSGNVRATSVNVYGGGDVLGLVSTVIDNNGMLIQVNGDTTQRLRFTSDSSRTYLQTDKPLTLSAPFSGTARQIFDTSGDISSHGTYAGISMYERTTDTNFFTWYNSGSTLRLYSSTTGFNKFSIDANGNILGDAANAIAIGWLNDPALTGTALQTNPSTANNGALVAVGRSSGNKVWVVRGASGQVADLEQWQNNTGSSLAEIDSGGGAHFPAAYIGARVSYGTLTVTPVNAATIGEVIRGFASQSASMQEWQDNGGGVRAKIDGGGGMYAQAGIFSATIPPPYLGARVSSTSASATEIGIIAKGAASQTADLQQWQTSTGSVVAAVGPAGVFALHGAGNQLILCGRDNDAQSFSWYVSGNAARLYSNTAGADKLIIDSAGNITATGQISAPYLFLTRQNTTGEGGEFRMQGSNGNPDWIQDLLNGSMRFWRQDTGYVALTLDTAGKVTAGAQLFEGVNRVYSAANPPPGGSGGATVKAVQTTNSTTNSFLTGGSFYNAAVYTQVSASLTIVCGASGVITLDYTFTGVWATASTPLCVTAAQSTTDAANSFSTGQATTAYMASTNGYNVTMSGRRVITGLTPGSSYTFAVYAATQSTSSIYYSYTTDQTYQTKPNSALKAITY